VFDATLRKPGQSRHVHAQAPQSPSPALNSLNERPPAFTDSRRKSVFIAESGGSRPPSLRKTGSTG
jgi:hypothetical protein